MSARCLIACAPLALLAAVTATAPITFDEIADHAGVTFASNSSPTPVKHQPEPMVGGVAIFGLCTLVFALSRNPALSIAALFVLGCGDMLSVYVRAILVQLQTPDAIRGRVSAINSMFIGGSNELGEFESGVTARWLGLVPAALLGGVLTLAVVGVWMLLFPQLRRLDRLR